MNATPAPLLEELTARLVTEFRPDRIILFGSRVWGKPTADSDVDLLVVVPESDESPVRRAQRAQRCLGNLRVPTDVLVKTRAEADRLGPLLKRREDLLELGAYVLGHEPQIDCRERLADLHRGAAHAGEDLHERLGGLELLARAGLAAALGAARP